MINLKSFIKKLSMEAYKLDKLNAFEYVVTNLFKVLIQIKIMLIKNLKSHKSSQ